MITQEWDQGTKRLLRLGYFVGMFLALVLPSESAEAFQDKKNSEKTAPSLGVSQVLEQVVLPGTLLTHKKVDPKKTPLMVRVIRSFPHGDAYRYDISYFGMTPGKFDLRDYLVREDGSSTENLPPIPVTVNTILEEGQVEPNELEIGALSRYGGYWQLLLIGAIAWVAILAAMIFVGRKRQVVVEKAVEKKATLADLLKPSVERAMSGDLPKEKHAELERLLFGFWRRKLKISDMDSVSALRHIRNHEKSGPLIKQVEVWLHSPPGTENTIDLGALLAPYREFDASEFDDGTENAEVESEGRQ